MAALLTFSILSYILLITGVFGVVFSGILFKSRSRVNNWPIALLVLGMSLILLQYMCFWTGLRFKYKYLYFFDHSWYLLFGPLFYSYLSKFYTQKIKISLYHFLPAFISFCLSFWYLFRTNGFFDFSLVKDEIFFKAMWNLRSQWLATFSLATYLWFTIDLIKVNNLSSNKNSAFLLRTKWSNYLLWFFGVFIFSYSFYWAVVSNVPGNQNWDIIAIVMSLCLFGIGYMVFKEPQIFNGELMASLFIAEHKKKNTISVIHSSTKERAFDKLISYIENEKPYLDFNLRLVNIADSMGVSTHFLSQLVNHKSGKNFNKFINEYRLKEAEDLLKSSEPLKIKNIYLDVGFNSKAAFYKSFKQKNNCTPSEYRSKFLSS